MRFTLKLKKIFFMNRRFFLRNGSLAGLTFTTNGIGAIASAKELVITELKDSFELDEITIDELQQKMQKGQPN
jgi:amidase